MKKVTAIVFGGREITFSQCDLNEFLTNPKFYYCADNLPKWIAQKYMKEGRTYDLGYILAKRDIREAYYAETSTVFNVRSDRSV